MKQDGLIGLIEKPDGGHWFLDLNECVAGDFINSLEQRKAITQNLLVCVDAKATLKTLLLTPSPSLRIICLSTIKKLIGKSIHETISLPDFSSGHEALAWCKQAMAAALSLVDKLEMTTLCQLESRVISATMAMEEQGLPFDKEQWCRALKHFYAENHGIKQRLESLLVKDDGFLLFGPNPIDLNNHQAVKEALEKVLGKKLTSTSQSSLKDIDHEAAQLIIQYREHARMQSTYGEDFLAKITDRLRGTFTPLGSASGRFSCHDPNLLALPNHPAFQACLKPNPARRIIHFDYGAFELRILAALSNDQALVDIFAANQDIHSMVASRVFNIEVSKTNNVHLRDQAKVLNFGIIYGMGEHALAQQLKIALSEAKELLHNYFKQFATVDNFLRGLESFAKRHGYVKTALNRRAYLEGDDFNPRVARNVPIQGTGADIIKLALCRVYQRFEHEKLDACIINVVHDELVIECAENNVDAASSMVKHEMEQAFSVFLPHVPAEISVT